MVAPVSGVKSFSFASGWKHDVIGNTWKVTADGEWFLPERTLGWEFIEFASRWYVNQAGEPFVLTDEQLRLALWLYALDEAGRFESNELVVQRLKGWGKDPFSMALAGFEMCGPCRFSHWDENGEAVGRRHPSPSIIIAAVSETQAKTTLKQARWLFSRAMIAEFGIDIGQVAITAFSGRADISVLSASFRSAEGRPTSFAIENEVQHWVEGNNGTDLAETVDGNIAKGSFGLSRKLMISNAFMPGEDSVLERTREAYFKAEEYKALHPDEPSGAGIYYDSLEADPDVPMTPSALREVLPEIRGDSVWLDTESFLSSTMKTSRPVWQSKRMYLNQIVSTSDALFEAGDLRGCVDRVPLRKGEAVALGFDGARKRDSTALIACRLSDKKLFTLAVWEKPDGDDEWRLESEVVDSAVQAAFREYQVLAFYADVNLWESEINGWSDQFRDRLVVKASSHSTVGYDMRGGIRRTTLTNETIVAAVQQKALAYDGHPTLTRHMLNVRRHNNNVGVSFRKESRDSPKKIDAYAAALLAFMAANDVAERGKIPEPKKSRRLLRRR